MQVIDDIRVVVCAAAGVILVADIVSEARPEEDCSDPGHTSVRVFDSLGDVVKDNRLGKEGHDVGREEG